MIVGYAVKGDVTMPQRPGLELAVIEVENGKTAGSGRRLLVIVVAVGAGWLVAHLPTAGQFTHSSGYLYGATTLLAIGLFGSTAGISLPKLRANTGIVVAAVTVGVVLKAALITAVMYWAYPEPIFLVVGVAIAQIDPLSVAALRKSSRLSEEAKPILAAWSSFDDPVTTLLSLYATALAVDMMGGTGTFAILDVDSFLVGLILNLVVVAVAVVVWRVLTRLAGSRFFTDRGLPRKLNAVAVALLVVMIGVAAWQLLFLGLAAAGLFFRPRLGPWLDRATNGAFLLASVGLGMLLLEGVEPWKGLWLGITAFAAQAVVAVLLTVRLRSGMDRAYLAVSQQNGITAIILALVLEQSLQGVAAVIAPAIVIINLMHLGFTPLVGLLASKRKQKPGRDQSVQQETPQQEPRRRDPFQRESAQSEVATTDSKAS